MNRKRSKKALWTKTFPGQVRPDPGALRAAAERIYKRMKGPYLRKNRTCKVSLLADTGRPKLVPASQIHHVRGRVGTLLIDRRFFLSVSGENHTWIHNNPEVARDFGFLCAKGQWNRAPADAETERLRRLILEEALKQ